MDCEARAELRTATNLPLEVRLTLPDGTRLLGVHASPGRDDGPGIQPKHSDDQLEQRLATLSRMMLDEGG